MANNKVAGKTRTLWLVVNEDGIMDITFSRRDARSFKLSSERVVPMVLTTQQTTQLNNLNFGKGTR